MPVQPLVRLVHETHVTTFWPAISIIRYFFGKDVGLIRYLEYIPDLTLGQHCQQSSKSKLQCMSWLFCNFRSIEVIGENNCLLLIFLLFFGLFFKTATIFHNFH